MAFLLALGYRIRHCLLAYTALEFAEWLVVQDRFLDNNVLSVSCIEYVLATVSKVIWLRSLKPLTADGSEKFPLCRVLQEYFLNLLLRDGHEEAFGYRFDAARSLVSQEDADLSEVAALALEGDDGLAVRC